MNNNSDIYDRTVEAIGVDGETVTVPVSKTVVMDPDHYEDMVETARKYDHVKEQLDKTEAAIESRRQRHKELQNAINARERWVAHAERGIASVLSKETDLSKAALRGMEPGALVGELKNMDDETTRKALLAAYDEIKHLPPLSHSDPDRAALSGAGDPFAAVADSTDPATEKDNLAKEALLAPEARLVAEFDDLSAAELIEEVYDLDFADARLQTSDDVRAEIAGRRDSPEVDRRREQLRRREEQRQARMMGLEAEAILDDRGSGADAENEAALADTGSTTQTVKAALTDAEDGSDDGDSPEYENVEELVRSALAGEDTATVAKHDADPVAFVATVYDLDAARFEDEIALRDEIAERQGTERVSIARQAWTAAQRDDATTELRAELSERLEDVDGFDA